MNLNLAGKKALVLGSSAGIGKSIAKALVDEGATVGISSRSEDKLERVAQEIGAASIHVGDLSVENEGERICHKFIDQHGSIDILIINTGGPQKGAFMDISSDQWKLDFTSLWLTPIEAIKTSLPYMQSNNYGRIMAVTSIAAKEPLKDLTTSNGLRAGLPGLFRSLSSEYAKDGITFNLLLPGYTNTDRIKALNLSEEKIREMVPAERLGDPEELASLATFLASDKGGYITAQSISVDGGVTKGL